MAPNSISNDFGVGANLSRTLTELEEILNMLMESEMRLWLLRKLLKEELFTWDIFHFAVNQANMRVTNKTLTRPQ